MNKMVSGYRRAASDWPSFLSCWRSAVDNRLAQGNSYSGLASLPSEVNRLPATVADPSVSEAILAAESRLGVKLPASYVDFLLATQGRHWFVEALGEIDNTGRMTGGFHAIGKIGWLKELDPDAFKLWSGSAAQARIRPEAYFRYGFVEDPLQRQNPVLFSKHDLEGLVLIGRFTEGALLLLNAQVKTTDGELEAWVLDTGTPGATRFRSFAEMALEIALGDASNAGPVISRPESLLAFGCARFLPIG